MDWFFLTLVSAITLAGADALCKRSFQGASGLELLVLRFGMPGLLLLPLVILHPLPPAPPAFWAWMALLVPMELGAMWCYMVAIRDCPLYLTLPYLAFTPVFNVFTGLLVLGESVSLEGFAGIMMVVAGAYLLNLDRFHARSLRGWLAPLRGILHERGSRLMLLAAAIYSLTSVFSKAAMGHVTPESFGPFYFTVLGAAALAIALLRAPVSLKRLAGRPGPLLMVGALMAIMVVTHFLAIARVEVAYMIAVKRSSLLFGILFGALLFGERHVTRHFLAGGLMVAGVALIVA
ncbi:MAG TPA: EamA family transporter [Gammaproteobacteria bacterium]|nr:EamA family transporter [Gammaproteobacteria bacterium]